MAKKKENTKKQGAKEKDLAGRIRKMKKNDTQICCSIGFLTEKQHRQLTGAKARLGQQMDNLDIMDCLLLIPQKLV